MVGAVTTPSRKAGAPRQVVFSFDEGTAESRAAAVRGGKGAHLAEMVALGLPVPPGFTVTTTVSRAFWQNGRIPKRVTGQIDRAMHRLERQTSEEFGNPDNPLLVSVRSGAQASMPGMMDTVLNIGLNPDTVVGLARHHGVGFALDAYQRFLVQFGQVVLGVPAEKLEYAIRSAEALAEADDGGLEFETLAMACKRLRTAIEFNTCRPVPDNPTDQLYMAIDAVMRSWTSERAVAYRAANNLPSWWGTAVNVQAMAHGNRSSASGSGVVFSHDTNTGLPGLNGEYLPQSQGEDIVAGTHNPLPVAALAEQNLAVYQNLEHLVGLLADHLGDMVDVEFTVEDGELYLLQVRPAKRTPMAAATFAVHQVWAKKLSRDEAILAVKPADVRRLRVERFIVAESVAPAITRGLAASAGVAVGGVATTSAQAQLMAAAGWKVVLVTQDTTPEDLPGMLCSQAVVTATGGATCHAAVVARERGLPAVVGVGLESLRLMPAGTLVSVDGTNGVVYGDKLQVESNLTKETRIFLRWVRRFGHKPSLNFKWLDARESANLRLNDFYLIDAMMNASVGSPLEDEVAELRDKVHRETAELFVTYLAVAVAGESRYAFRSMLEPASVPELQVLAGRFGVTDWMRREQAQLSIVDALRNRSAAYQAEFFELCATIFGHPNWRRNSYGGKPWAKIAQAGQNYLAGKLTATEFVDHVFDLRHNGGKLFDKHPMLSELTNELLIAKALDDKKLVSSPVSLFGVTIRRPQGVNTFSVPVLKTYKKGLDQHIWEV